MLRMLRIRSFINIKKHAERCISSSSDWINYCIGHPPNVINRAAHLRKNSEWLESKQNASDSEFIVFMGMRPVGEYVSGGSVDLQMSRFTCHELEPFLKGQGSQPLCIFLGIDGGRPLFMVGFNQTEESLLNEKRHVVTGFISVKPLADRRLFFYARSLLSWNKSNLFCGQCGSPTTSCDGGHKRVCSNTSCGRHDKRSYGDHAASHPRSDPAVLVVITDGQRCLLARKPSFPPTVLSCIAGFVEPGETLEDAVVREVQEETGLAVSSVRYIMSQPWPFDSVIKFGCLASVTSSEVVLDTDELHFAEWFSLDEVRQMLKFRHPKWNLPSPLLLGYQIMDFWVKGQCEQNSQT